MIRNVKVNGEEKTAIVFNNFNEKDMPDFANAMLSVFALVFSRDENMEYVDSFTMYMILELYKAMTEKGGES